MAVERDGAAADLHIRDRVSCNRRSSRPARRRGRVDAGSREDRRQRLDVRPPLECEADLGAFGARGRRRAVCPEEAGRCHVVDRCRVRVGSRLERVSQLAAADGEEPVAPRRARCAVVAQGRRRLADAPFERQRARRLPHAVAKYWRQRRLCGRW